MYVKIHVVASNYGIREVIAVADEDLIGKILREKHVEFKVSESFYKGEKKTEAEVIDIIKKAGNINFIGKQAVVAGLKAGVISKESIITIQGIPHAQTFALQ